MKVWITAFLIILSGCKTANTESAAKDVAIYNSDGSMTTVFSDGAMVYWVKCSDNPGASTSIREECGIIEGTSTDTRNVTVIGKVSSADYVNKLPFDTGNFPRSDTGKVRLEKVIQLTAAGPDLDKLKGYLSALNRILEIEDSLKKNAKLEIVATTKDPLSGKSLAEVLTTPFKSIPAPQPQNPVPSDPCKITVANTQSGTFKVVSRGMSDDGEYLESAGNRYMLSVCPGSPAASVKPRSGDQIRVGYVSIGSGVHGKVLVGVQRLSIVAPVATDPCDKPASKSKCGTIKVIDRNMSDDGKYLVSGGTQYLLAECPRLSMGSVLHGEKWCFEYSESGSGVHGNVLVGIQKKDYQGSSSSSGGSSGGSSSGTSGRSGRCGSNVIGTASSSQACLNSSPNNCRAILWDPNDSSCCCTQTSGSATSGRSGARCGSDYLGTASSSPRCMSGAPNNCRAILWDPNDQSCCCTDRR